MMIIIDKCAIMAANIITLEDNIMHKVEEFIVSLFQECFYLLINVSYIIHPVTYRMPHLQLNIL